jgi:hypothetical protein
MTTNVDSEESDNQATLAWVREQRASVLTYLAAEGVEHGQVAEQPSWLVAPYVAVWSVTSLAAPGRLGWWAISGDVPTDYVSASGCPDARAAVRAIASRWTEAAQRMTEGRIDPAYSIGAPTEAASLGPLLASRAALLATWVSDDEVWA